MRSLASARPATPRYDGAKRAYRTFESQLIIGWRRHAEVADQKPRPQKTRGFCVLIFKQAKESAQNPCHSLPKLSRFALGTWRKPCENGPILPSFNALLRARQETSITEVVSSDILIGVSGLYGWGILSQNVSTPDRRGPYASNSTVLVSSQCIGHIDGADCREPGQRAAL